MSLGVLLRLDVGCAFRMHHAPQQQALTLATLLHRHCINSVAKMPVFHLGMPSKNFVAWESGASNILSTVTPH